MLVFEMECGKRETKVTAKALVNKIEKLEQERKIIVNKMKGLIPEIKELLKRDSAHNNCCRVLLQSKLYGRVAKRKPLLEKAHIKS